MPAPRLKYSDYSTLDMEACGSFFTSIKFISTEHCHDFFELCLITEGKIMHIINGKRQRLNAGNCLFIRPDDIHYFEAINSEYFQYINLALLPKTVYDMFEYLGDGFKPERFLDSPNPLCVEIPKSEMEFVKRKLEYFILNQRYDKSALKTELRASLVSFITQYYPVHHWNRKTSVPVWLDWVYKEMQNKENFVGGLPLMQRLSCKSKEHLCRQFKKHFNKTPAEFINDLRLNYAKSLLVYSDKKIIEISYDSGFQSLSHFCHEFKKKYLVSPKEYRKLYNNIIGTKSSESD